MKGEMSENLNHPEILKRSNEAFDLAASSSVEPNMAVKWGNPQTQYFRFSELIRHLDLNDPGKTLLDVGGGNGELLRFLNFSGYRGCDINAELVAQARKRFPRASSQLADLLADNSIARCSYVVMSGLFNADCGQTGVSQVHSIPRAALGAAQAECAPTAPRRGRSQN